MGILIAVFQALRAIARTQRGREYLDTLRVDRPHLVAVIDFATSGSWQEFTDAVDRNGALLEELVLAIAAARPDGRKVKAHLEEPANKHEENSAAVAALLRAGYCVMQECQCDVVFPLTLGERGVLGVIPLTASSTIEAPLPLRDGVKVDALSIDFRLIAPDSGQTADEVFRAYLEDLGEHMVNQGPPFHRPLMLARGMGSATCKVLTMTAQRLEASVKALLPLSPGLAEKFSESQRAFHAECVRKASALGIDEEGHIKPSGGVYELISSGIAQLPLVVAACGMDVVRIPELAAII